MNFTASQIPAQLPAVRNGNLLWIGHKPEMEKVSAPADVPEQKRISVPIQKKDGLRVIQLDSDHRCPFFPRTDFAGLLLLTVIKSCPKPVLRFQEKFTGFLSYRGNADAVLSCGDRSAGAG